jgi:hypothetical protein
MTNPAASCSASLASHQGRRSQTQALGVIAWLFTGAESADFFLFPWESLRFEHSSAIRSRLIERYSPSSAILPQTS